MAAVPRPTNCSPVTLAIPASCKHSNMKSAVDLKSADACYIQTNGLVNKSNGTAANAAAVVDGWCAEDDVKAAQEQGCTLLFNCTFNYGTNLTPGTSYYLGTVAGNLDTAPTTGGTVPIARAITSSKLYVTKSY